MRRRLLLFAIFPAVLAGQDGSTIYKANCAVCHDHPVGRVPTESALSPNRRSDSERSR